MQDLCSSADDYGVRILAVRLVPLIMLISVHWAVAEGNPAHSNLILPSPEPFSLSGYDAAQAIAMIRREKLLEYWDGNSLPRILPVHTIWAVFIRIDHSAFPGHRIRYDLVLNGNNLDWDHTYIDFDGSMTNLRLLFTYRNQYPPTDIHYRIPEN
jgi:hypothetical protein